MEFGKTARPKAAHRATFDLPPSGTEVRIASLLVRGDDVKVVFAHARASKVTVPGVRSEAEMAALKAQAATQQREDRGDPQKGRRTQKGR